MEGKFNNWHKCLEVACFVLILTSSIYKGLFCDGDMGVVITLSFVAILLFIILSIFVTEFNPLPKGYGKMRGKNT